MSGQYIATPHHLRPGLLVQVLDAKRAYPQQRPFSLLTADKFPEIDILERHDVASGGHREQAHVILFECGDVRVTGGFIGK